MSYKKQIDLLPKELIEKIQEYVDGKVIYIPKKDVNKKKWGENTDTKQFLASRNQQIGLDFQNGMSIKQLSEKYYLSEKSIQRIIKQNNLWGRMCHDLRVAHFFFKKKRKVTLLFWHWYN